MPAEGIMVPLTIIGSDTPADIRIQVFSALQRLIMVCDSPGVRMAAAWSLELLTGMGIGGRPIPAKSGLLSEFVISVTVLSRDMNHVLVRKHPRGDRLPRQILQSQATWITHVPSALAREVTGDPTAELALMGRPLSVELWDDDPKSIKIGLNFLAIARGTDVVPASSEWCFKEFAALNLNSMDPRETLALSEMLTMMGINHPYDLQQSEEDSKAPQMMHPAA